MATTKDAVNIGCLSYAENNITKPNKFAVNGIKTQLRPTSLNVLGLEIGKLKKRKKRTSAAQRRFWYGQVRTTPSLQFPVFPSVDKYW